MPRHPNDPTRRQEIIRRETERLLRRLCCGGGASQTGQGGGWFIDAAEPNDAADVPQQTLCRERYCVRTLAPQWDLCCAELMLLPLLLPRHATALWHWEGGGAVCVHLHLSAPLAAETCGEETRRLRRLSYEDALTGLWNRNRFDALCADLTAAPPPRLGVAYLDVNGLKEANDRHGHRFGDELLRRTGEVLRQRFPAGSYRIGGDEFALIDTDSSQEQFRRRLDETLRALRQAGIRVAAGMSWRAERCEISAQIEEADREMYRAKAAFYHAEGRDRRRQ